MYKQGVFTVVEEVLIVKFERIPVSATLLATDLSKNYHSETAIESSAAEVINDGIDK